MRPRRSSAFRGVTRAPHTPLSALLSPSSAGSLDSGNMAHTRQPRTDSGPGFQVKGLKLCELSPLRSQAWWGTLAMWGDGPQRSSAFPGVTRAPHTPLSAPVSLSRVRGIISEEGLRDKGLRDEGQRPTAPHTAECPSFTVEGLRDQGLFMSRV